jgi:Fic family protein
MAQDVPLYTPFPDFADWSVDYDETAFSRYRALLATSKEEANPAALDDAVRIATRIAAVDTGAIEGLYATDRGFTMTVALDAAMWDLKLDERGEQTRRSVEDAMRAYEYVLDAAVGSQPISEMWIRQLHEIVCASQDLYTVYTAAGPQEQPLPKGQYKAQPNSPTNRKTGVVHAYCPVDDTPMEMRRLVEQLSDEAFIAAPPVVQAAYAQYAFVCVHPFADGNGRVSRALASIWLYRDPGVPLVIFAEQKSRYLDALEAADAGNPVIFVDFISQRVIDAIEIVRTHIQPPLTPPSAESFKLIEAIAKGRGGLTHEEFDAAGARLVSTVEAESRRLVSILEPPKDVTPTVERAGSVGVKPRDGYRMVGPEHPMLIMRVDGAGATNAQSTLWIQAAAESTDGSDFVVVAVGSKNSLEVSLGEIHPEVSPVLGLKLTAWITRELDYVAHALAAANARVLKKRGY